MEDLNAIVMKDSVDWKLLPSPQAAQRARLSFQGRHGTHQEPGPWLDQNYPSAAGSLIAGLEECFTINRLDISPSPCRCVATTYIIESTHAVVRIQAHRGLTGRTKNGAAVDGLIVPAHRETLQQDHEPPRLIGLKTILNPAQ